MNQTNIVMLAILALGMVGSSLTTILPSVHAQTSSGQAGSSSPPSSSSPSQQGSEHACPTGFTLSQGQCTAPVTLVCQPFFGGTITLLGSRCDAIVHGPDFVLIGLGDECAKLPNGSYSFNANPTTEHFGECQYDATPTCPGGITPTSGQCVTRPGQGSQP